MNTRFAAALNDQGRFANTSVGDFNFVPEAGAHIWKGRIATSASELAEHVNGAVKSLEALADPFASLRVVEMVDKSAPAATDQSTPESEKTSLLQANEELREVVTKSGPTLRILEHAA